VGHFPIERKPVFSSTVPNKVREVIKMLEKAGWRHVRTSGNHRVFRSPDGRITIVSGNLGDDVKPGTYRAILRQTGIKEPEE
jgi:predicted RNA binding protein YcfA (HicA-like mRNA interferase family)